MHERMNRWPHIARFLRVDAETGLLDHDYSRWHFANVRESQRSVELSRAYEEWADYFEWALVQKATELAVDCIRRHLVEEWTDSMAYCCRRSAVWARGEEVGEWVSQHVRRPDLEVERKAIVAEIIARLGARSPNKQLCPVG